MLGKKMKLKTNRIKATFLKTQQQPKKKKKTMTNRAILIPFLALSTCGAFQITKD